jgi:hypothetical protein
MHVFDTFICASDGCPAPNHEDLMTKMLIRLILMLAVFALLAMAIKVLSTRAAASCDVAESGQSFPGPSVMSAASRASECRPSA